MSYRAHGLVKGNPYIGGVYPVAASQYFWHGHGNFVAIDASGNLTIALTASEDIFGWAMVPSSAVGAGAAGSKYWLSSATAAADSLFVCTDPNAWFSMPTYSTEVGEAARVGEAADINCTNDGTTAGQTVTFATTSHDILLVMGYDANDTSVAYVRMNPNELSRDT